MKHTRLEEGSESNELRRKREQGQPVVAGPAAVFSSPSSLCCSSACIPRQLQMASSSSHFGRKRVDERE